MTGYGRALAEVNGVQINISIKTVNNRFLDVRPHLPKQYYPLEEKIIKAAKGMFLRGSCDIYIQRSMSQGRSGLKFSFQTDLAADWLKAYRKSLKSLKIDDTLSAKDLLNIPDFVTWQEDEEISAKESSALLKALDQALKSCLKERQREGQFLQKTCLQHLKDLEKQTTKLRSLRKDLVKDAQTKFQERLDKILTGQEWDQARIAQEVAVLVDKTDVEEELSRLSEHIKNVKNLLSLKEPVGKKLDFYAQELLREVNTIGSKSQSAKITEEVVESKSLVEQLREQIQNIE